MNLRIKFRFISCKNYCYKNFQIVSKYYIIVFGFTVTPYFPYPLENNVKKIKRHKFVDAWMEANVGDFNVDFLLRDAQDKRVAVEITVTHKTEKAKIDFFKKIDLTAIEIDLSKYHKKNMNESDLRKSIFFTPNNVNYLNSNSIDKRNELRQKQINETLKNH